MARRARIGKVVSGGQTGVDRAALDVAIDRGIPYGGWCPAGGWAEDLTRSPGLLARYPELTATPSRETRQRTRWNVRDSDATIVFTAGPAHSPGTDLARLAATELGRPLTVVDLLEAMIPVALLKAALESLPEHAVLNLSGPRESEAEGIYVLARRALEVVLPSR